MDDDLKLVTRSGLWRGDKGSSPQIFPTSGTMHHILQLIKKRSLGFLYLEHFGLQSVSNPSTTIAYSLNLNFILQNIILLLKLLSRTEEPHKQSKTKLRLQNSTNYRK